jgi:hypothetical protein
MRVTSSSPFTASSVDHQMGTMSLADIIWLIQELCRELAQFNIEYNQQLTAINRRAEQDAKGREVATYRSTLSRILTLSSALLNGIGGAAGFGGEQWKQIAEGYQYLAKAAEGIKQIEEMGNRGDQTEASAASQLAGNDRQQAQEAVRRAIQEMQDALNQMQKATEGKSSLVDQLVR